MIGLLVTASASASQPYRGAAERDIIAAMQNYEYRYNTQDVPFRDIVVSMHGRIAYAYASIGLDGRGALLENDGGLWHVKSLAKGQFPPDVFSEIGVPARIAEMAVKTECPPLRIPAREMTSDQRELAKNSHAGHVPARHVRDLDDRSIFLVAVSYRVCDI